MAAGLLRTLEPNAVRYALSELFRSQRESLAHAPNATLDASLLYQSVKLRLKGFHTLAGIQAGTPISKRSL